MLLNYLFTRRHTRGLPPTLHLAGRGPLAISTIPCELTSIAAVVPGAHLAAGDGERGAMAALPFLICGERCSLDVGSTLLKKLNEGEQVVDVLLQRVEHGLLLHCRQFKHAFGHPFHAIVETLLLGYQPGRVLLFLASREERLALIAFTLFV